MRASEHIFAEGNKIRSKKTGKVYTVKTSDVDLGFAFVEDVAGNIRTIDWFYGSGALDTEKLNAYEMVDQ
jgi:hypothetical protein